MRAKVLKISGNRAWIEFDEEVFTNSWEKDSDGYFIAEYTPNDSRYISADQRKHFYALVHDYSYYTGDPEDAVESKLKFDFMILKGLDEFPSLAHKAMTRSRASELLEYVITWMIQHDVPFRNQQWYLSMDASKVIYALTQKRVCVVCGAIGADIHHVDAIGMGADRKTHDHSQHKYLALCRKHHNESHTMGQDTFMKKHILKPVKLTAEDLKRLGVM